MKKLFYLNHKKLFRTLIIVFILFLIIYFLVTLVCINYYLNEYGYGIKELPKTIAVYLHLSKGFTIEQNENGESYFIGRHRSIYGDLLIKKGYNESILGASATYTKDTPQGQSEIFILGTGDWCHWFRIYIIEGAKIEDLI